MSPTKASRGPAMATLAALDTTASLGASSALIPATQLATAKTR